MNIVFVLSSGFQAGTPAKPTTHWSADTTVGTCIICQGAGVQPGDEDAIVEICTYCKGTVRELPALYASDHDMFAFLVNYNLHVKSSNSTAPCSRASSSNEL